MRAAFAKKEKDGQEFQEADVDWVEVRESKAAGEAFGECIPSMVKAARVCQDERFNWVDCVTETEEKGGSLPEIQDKCSLLELQWQLCLASFVLPEDFKEFDSCVNSDKEASCEDKLDKILGKVVEEMGKFEAAKEDLTKEEQAIIQECDDVNMPEEDRLRKGLNCFIPKVCPTQTSALLRCLRSNKGDLDRCSSEGKDSMKCWGKFVGRWYSKME